MKNKLQIIDRTFQHSKLGYCSDYQISDDFEWSRTDYDPEKPTVYTDMVIGSNTIGKPENSYAWLIEPICIANNLYTTIKKSENLYDKIFTHEKTLLDKSDKYQLAPFGCCWIEPKDQIIYDKTKNVSIISSNKTMTYGHKLRHNVISSLKDKIDVFGRGYNPINYKLEGLKNYRFQIVIENCKRDYWFTEKLIDCFVTGTIPIYWGCPSIGDFFDTNGIISFDDIDELSKVIETLDEDFYINHLDSVKNNFEKSKNYLLPDQHVYNYLKG